MMELSVRAESSVTVRGALIFERNCAPTPIPSGISADQLPDPDHCPSASTFHSGSSETLTGVLPARNVPLLGVLDGLRTSSNQSAPLLNARGVKFIVAIFACVLVGVKVSVPIC